MIQCFYNVILPFQETFQLDQHDHYQFKQIGHMVTGSDVAHLAVPIDITDLQKQLHMAHQIASQLLTLSTVLGVQTRGRLYVQSLSHTADITYENLNNKYNTIVFYYTRNSQYDSDKVFKDLEARRKPVGRLLPNPDKSP